MSLKAIIFDVDGVIFHTHTLDGTYLWSRTVKHDLGMTTAHFQKIFSSKWEALVRGQRDTKKYLLEVFQDPLFQSLSLTPDIYMDYWLKHDIAVDQSILDYVQSLATPCYLGTNQESYRKKHILQLVGKHFFGCFASCDIGFFKPEVEFFEYIEHSLSLHPSEIILIDDTKDNITAAAHRGWQTYHYQNDLSALRKFLTFQET